MTFQSVLLVLYMLIMVISGSVYAQAAANDELIRRAETGDAGAQATLGYLYQAGEGLDQDDERAIHWYTQAATRGNADAQYNLAVAYAFGTGVTQDHEIAADWYRRAAEQGHALAQYSLAISYALGEGIAQDARTAADWFKRSAEQGYLPAQVQLASKYHTGAGVPVDFEEAVRWYTPAADEDDPVAQYNLAGMYRAGTGVEQDYARALMWYQRAADLGYEPALTEIEALQHRLAAAASPAVPVAPQRTEPIETSTYQDIEDSAPTEDVAEPSGLLSIDDINPSIPVSDSETVELLADGPSVPRAETADMPAPVPAITPANADTTSEVETPGQIVSPETPPVPGTPLFLYTQGMDALKDRDYQQALTYFRPPAAQGEALAQHQLAIMFYQGLGVNQDYTEAALWYRRAAEQGNSDAQFSLGNLFLSGEGVSRDALQAKYWYEQAAAQGHTGARHNLDNIDFTPGISSGPGQHPDDFPDTLSKLMSSAPETVYQSGMAYEMGTGVEKDLGTAYTLFERAAEQGHALAQYKLGNAYAYGTGTGKDAVKAVYWYQQAATQGLVTAQRALALLYEQGVEIEGNKPLALAWYSILVDSGNLLDKRREEQLRNELAAEDIAGAQQLKQELLQSIKSRGQ